MLRAEEIRVRDQAREEVHKHDLGVGFLLGELLHEERRHAGACAGGVADGVVLLEEEVVGPELAFLAAGEDGDDTRRGRGAEEREQVDDEAHAGVVADGGDFVEAFGRGVAGGEGEVAGGEAEDVNFGGR